MKQNEGNKVEVVYAVSGWSKSEPRTYNIQLVPKVKLQGTLRSYLCLFYLYFNQTLQSFGGVFLKMNDYFLQYNSSVFEGCISWGVVSCDLMLLVISFGH